MTNTKQDDRAQPFSTIAVLGAGAWGTALASVARRAGSDVWLWGRDADVLSDISKSGSTPRYLPGVDLPKGIRTTTDLVEACKAADAVLIVTPSRTIREIAHAVRPHLKDDAAVVLCAKGIEAGTGLLLSEVARTELPGHAVGALSGPTFARETALGHPTAATIAFAFSYADRLAPAISPAARLALTLGSESFRPYVSDDLVGVEVAGAVKNVVAIACGIVTGAGYAENTRAVLITRGMQEMRQLAQALGGRHDTVSGLSGAGDLMLTCSSTTSRNMSLGVQLGQGTERKNCFDGKPVVVEGEVNAVSVVQLARRIGVSLPICEAVHAVLHQNTPFQTAFSSLWTRPLRSETDGLNLAMPHPSRSGDGAP